MHLVLDPLSAFPSINEAWVATLRIPLQNRSPNELRSLRERRSSEALMKELAFFLHIILGAFGN